MKIDFVKQFYLLSKLWDFKFEGFEIKAFVTNNAKFLFFLSFLVGVYIANAHLVERKVRQIRSLSQELQTVRWEYLTIQSNVLSDGKLSNVTQRVESLGLQPLNEQPEKLLVANGH